MLMKGASLPCTRRLRPLIQCIDHRWPQFYPRAIAGAQFSQRSSCGRLLSLSSWSSAGGTNSLETHRPAWSQEWKSLGLGASLVDGCMPLTNLLFVQVGFGVDQHGKSNDATKAAIRAVRNAIEFNSIPGVIEAVPGGRKEMLIQVKLGIPATTKHDDSGLTLECDVLEVAKVFPYGKLLPIEIVVGGLSFPTGRIVEELGDTDDMAVCVAACVSIGYNNGESNGSTHATYSTKDGY